MNQISGTMILGHTLTKRAFDKAVLLVRRCLDEQKGLEQGVKAGQGS
jgi:hypothetical protein